MNMTNLLNAIDAMGKGIGREVAYDRFVRRLRIGEVAAKHGLMIEDVRKYEIECYRHYNKIVGKPTFMEKVEAVKSEIDAKAKELGGVETDEFKAWHNKRFGTALDMLEKIESEA